MPVKSSRKRGTRSSTDEVQKEETYTKKLKRKKVEAEERAKTADKGNNVEEGEPGANDNSNHNNNDLLLLDFKPRMNEPLIHGYNPLAHRSQNLVHFLQQYAGGQKTTIKLKQSLSSTVVSRISDLQLCRNASPFDRRVTCMEWHPTNPNVLAVGSKGGDILLWDTVNAEKDQIIQGIGAGGIMNAIKFWPDDYSLVLSAAVDGTVRLNDVEGRNSKILADTMNAHDFWYCSVDVNPTRKLVVAGDNVGNTQLLSYEGRQVFNCRLHKQKVTHTEFSPREEWLLCTASTDQTVQLWDIRMMKDRKSSLHVLKHDKGVNSAYFSGTDGCRLLTTDQKNQVRVYRAPVWDLERTVQHPHRFFQHITPIKATWHPLQDLAVIGRYPDPNFPGYYEGELRSIDIIDVESGELVSSLSDPSASGLICVNKFNRRGDVLASGMGLHILLWTRKEEVSERQTSLLASMKSALGSGSLDNAGNTNRRQRRQPKSKDTKQEKKTTTQNKQDKEKLKQKMKSTKK